MQSFSHKFNIGVEPPANLRRNRTSHYKMIQDEIAQLPVGTWAQIELDHKASGLYGSIHNWAKTNGIKLESVQDHQNSVWVRRLE